MPEDTTDEKLAALLARLTDQTRAGRVRWEPADSGAFTLGTPSGAVTVASRFDNGREPYVFTLHDADGRLVELVSADLFPLVEPLYRVVRRQVLQTGAVIDGLLRDLSG